MSAAHLLATLVCVQALPGSRVAALDCNSNGVEDALELIADPDKDCNSNGRLDECDVGLHRGFFDDTPIAFFGFESSFFLARDLEPDGDTDLLGSSYPETPLFLLENDGTGSFESTTRVARTSEYLRAAADLDGDRDIDLVVWRPAREDILTLLNDGAGSFVEGHATAVQEVFEAADADLDGDGDADLVAVVGLRGFIRNLVVLTNVGEGAFAAPRRLQTSGSPASPATADFDGDGLQDVASIIDFRSVQVFINSGDAFFEAGPLLDAGTSSGLRSLHAADVDLDGDIDLAVDSVRETCMLRNDGSPRFAASCLFLGECGVPRALGDFDGDGAPDLAVLCRGGPSILWNARGGRFEPPRRAGSLDQDHRFESLVTGDFDLDGALDLAAAPSPTILWNRSMRLSLDCNGDGRPDECDALSGSADAASGGAGCRDCNGNGIPDSTDIELGYQDADGNRVPDACEVRRFVLVADGPRVVRAEPGDRVSIPAAVDLHSLDFEPGESGASGWLVYLKANNASIEDVTLEGTTAAARPEGFRNPSASFVNLGLIRKEDHCKGALRAAVALDLIEPTALDPAESPHTILRLTLGATVPLDGTGFSGLHFMSCDSCSDADPAPTEGGGGCGGVDASYVGTPTDFPPTTTRDGIILLTPSAFRRGDSNVDGAVDISDPIRTLMFLFMGSTDLHCLDAADSNDDGSIDLTDAILIFDDFFRPGTGIPAPGPFACGHDPTPDGSGCDAYGPCGD